IERLEEGAGHASRFQAILPELVRDVFGGLADSLRSEATAFELLRREIADVGERLPTVDPRTLGRDHPACVLRGRRRNLGRRYAASCQQCTEPTRAYDPIITESLRDRPARFGDFFLPRVGSWEFPAGRAIPVARIVEIAFEGVDDPVQPG